MVAKVGKGEALCEEMTKLFTKRLVRLRGTLEKYKREDNETEAAWRKRVDEEVTGSTVRKRANARRATVSTCLLSASTKCLTHSVMGETMYHNRGREGCEGGRRRMGRN